jgi:glycosyltransferase involved in cell wall biosynthesis
MRIAVVTETYPPEINGVANTMRHLVEGLARRGHDLELVRPRQPADAGCGDPRMPPVEPRERLVPGLPIPGYRGLRLGLPVYWRLRGGWGKARPDVVYIATQGPLGHAALAAARALSIPTVTGFHTRFPQYSRHYGLGILTEPIARTLRHFHNRSDATLVPTADLRDELSIAGFRNVHVFGRGVDLELFSPARRDSALRDAWGCSEDDLVVLYVGRMAAEKNLDLVRETFEALGTIDRRVRCVLVGDGPALGHLNRDHPHYVCTGARVGEDLARHYASGDLFLFPSLTETYGNVVPEAMASGLPVLAFDYAAAHFCIECGVNGVTVPTGDHAAFEAAALRMAGDLMGLRAMGRAARASAEGMNWDRVLVGVEDRLLSVLRQRPGPERRDEIVASTAE